MSKHITKHNVIEQNTSNGFDSEQLSVLAREVLRLAAKNGASQAEVSINENSGLAVNVRLGAVETVERTRDRGVAVTVYFGQRKASASTADLQPDSLLSTVQQACAIAKFTEADPAAGLADSQLMATDFPDLDQWHPWKLDVDRAIAVALETEAAGREFDARISNSEGASVNTGESRSVYANSHGFLGFERSTHHSISCALIAGKNEGMQRDYWYTSALSADDLEASVRVGHRAAERAVSRLNPRPVKTGEYPVLFAPEMARSVIGHFIGAVSGGALYRRASFLLDSQGMQLFPSWLSMFEDPFISRGFRSASFDAEGVATRAQSLVSDGVLAHYVLGSYSARKLGLTTTANAGGIHNLSVSGNATGLDQLARDMGQGLLVTELMGQGVNTMTGDYSRGAAGFWVENGQIAYPFDEATIAGNLKTMFRDIVAIGSDVDHRSHVLVGSMLVGNMTVAGGC